MLSSINVPLKNSHKNSKTIISLNIILKLSFLIYLLLNIKYIKNPIIKIAPNNPNTILKSKIKL